eukprot:TRINITY_DN4154_c0_g5_i1.p1 TRINITY_DN4154_c0_g5~~TRINITY_DN4154_c0_g5_i1.p1  ORF type:complete len:211 (-),score=28.72 TRINITY_DN4154_c0_g5_i1:252-884(-)
MAEVAQSQAAKVAVQPKDCKNNQICGNPVETEVATSSKTSALSPQVLMSASSSSRPASPTKLLSSPSSLPDRSTRNATNDEIEKKVAQDIRKGASTPPHQKSLLYSIPSSKQAADSESPVLMPEFMLIRPERQPESKPTWLTCFRKMLRHANPLESEEERYSRLCSTLDGSCPPSHWSSRQPEPAPRSSSWPLSSLAVRLKSAGQVHPVS